MNPICYPRPGRGMTTLLLAFLFLSGLYGLDAVGQVPEPGIAGAKALRVQLGDPAAWEIVSKRGKSLETTSGTAPVSRSVPEDKNGNVVSRIQFARAQKIMRIVEESPSSPTKYFWIMDGFELNRTTPNTHVFLTVAGLPGTHDFEKSDFPELDWVLRTRAVAQRELRGQRCHVFFADAETVARFEKQRFEQRDDMLSAAAVRSGQRIAFISVETGLPVRVIEGEIMRDYEYPTPPTKIEVPEKVATASAEYQKP